jgi:hypothetical protein
MSPAGDWNCAEKGPAYELAAKAIVAAPIIADTPAIIPTLPAFRIMLLNRRITCPER